MPYEISLNCENIKMQTEENNSKEVKTISENFEKRKENKEEKIENIIGQTNNNKVSFINKKREHDFSSIFDFQVEKKSLINIKSSDIIKRIPIKDTNNTMILSEDKDITKLDYFEHLTLDQNKWQRRIIKFFKGNF